MADSYFGPPDVIEIGDDGVDTTEWLDMGEIDDEMSELEEAEVAMRRLLTGQDYGLTERRNVQLFCLDFESPGVVDAKEADTRSATSGRRWLRFTYGDQRVIVGGEQGGVVTYGEEPLPRDEMPAGAKVMLSFVSGQIAGTTEFEPSGA